MSPCSIRRAALDTLVRLLIAPAIFLGLGLFILATVWMFRRGLRVMAHLRKHGIQTEGTVTRLIRSGGAWTIRYRYRDNQSGKEYAGSGLVDGSQNHWPAIGDAIAVVYLPDKPWVSSLPSDL
jgi:hypothetical protein